MNYKSKTMLRVIFALIIVIIGIWFDVYRWHIFQEVTHSDIGFWKWNFLFGNRK